MLRGNRCRQEVCGCVPDEGPADGEANEQTRRFGTNNGDLEKLREWLTNCGCFHVVMASPSIPLQPAPALQIVEAFEDRDAVRYLLRDRDSIYGNDVRLRIA